MEDDDVVKNIFEILPWHDVLFQHVFCELSIEDKFNLRAVSRLTHAMMAEYFAQNQSLVLVPKFANVYKFDEAAYRVVTRNATGVKRFWIPNASDFLDDDLLVPVIEDNPSLEVISLHKCEWLTNRSLCMLGMHCQMLRIVMLEGCRWVDKDNFKLLIMNNLNIEKLDVSRCTKLDDRCIKLLGRKCKKLYSLNLTGLYIRDKSIKYIARNLPKLSILLIESCIHLSNNSIDALSEYATKLNFLSCKECLQIKESSLIKLRLRRVLLDVPVDEEYLNSFEFVEDHAELLLRLYNNNEIAS